MPVDAHIGRRLYMFLSYCTGLDGPLGLQEVEVPKISRQSAREGGMVVSPKHRPPLPTGRIPGTHFG